MHWQKSPKEKPCNTLPTVKKLLEQKRKRATTSSSSPSCSAVTTSPVPPSTGPVSSPEQPTSSGVSGSFSDMAVVGYETWDPVCVHQAPSPPSLQTMGVSYYSPPSVAGMEYSHHAVHSPPGTQEYSPPGPSHHGDMEYSYTAGYSSPLPSASFSTQQTQDYPDAMATQHYMECPVTVTEALASVIPSTYAWSQGARALGPLPSLHSPLQLPATPLAPPTTLVPSTPLVPAAPLAPPTPLVLQRAFGGQMNGAKLEEARMFLRGMDYNRTTWQDDDGDTILHIYVAKGLRELAFAAAERLRDLGRLDSKEHRGKTALLVAVAANQSEIVQDLLSLGADINACDVKGQTALHLAAVYSFPRVLQVLLSVGSAVDLEARDFEGLTPLHSAAISHGNTMKSLSSTPISTLGLGHTSLSTSHGGLSSSLSTSHGGLSSSLSTSHGGLSASLSSSLSSSLSAGLCGLPTRHASLPQAEEKLSCLQMLLHSGASLLSQEIKSNKTVLHLAVKEGNIQLVRYLLRLHLTNIREFVNLKAHGHTALHMAAGLHGNPHQEEMLHLLLSRGADPSVRNLENDQPAHLLQSGPRGEKLRPILKKRSVSSRRRVQSLQDQE